MIDLPVSEFDFSPMHRRMQRYVDQGTLPGLSTLTLRGQQIVDLRCYGSMDLESGKPLAPDTLFRLHSNSKLITSVAAMILCEEGKLRLDAPLAEHIPKFADVSVFKPDAQGPNDLEPLRVPITLRHLLTHTSGLSYGFLDSDHVVDRTYAAAGVFQSVFLRKGTLESLVHSLCRMPLAFQPGTAWRYSLATDVISRVIELVSGEPFDQFLERRIFQPLGMHDTGFWVPEDKRERLATLYTKQQDQHVSISGPNGSLYFDPGALKSGGGGLISTITDYARLVCMLSAGGTWNGVRLLQPRTIELMRSPQIAAHLTIGSHQWHMPNTTYGLGVAVKLRPSDGEPPSAVGEFHWGGMAGTHWWISPHADLSGLVMAQVLESFWRPFSHEFKRMAYEIAGAR